VKNERNRLVEKIIKWKNWGSWSRVRVRVP
jgi:hypothetical protein